MKKQFGWMLIVFAALNTVLAHADDRDDVAYQEEQVVNAEDSSDDIASLDEDFDDEE